MLARIVSSKGKSMSRLLFRAAAALVCVLATTGCASLGQSEGAASLTSPEATKSAGDTDNNPYAALARKLPRDLDGEIRRAQLLRAASDFAGATRSLSQLMLVAPDDPRVVGEYGKVLAQQGRSADALAFLSRAIELQPDNWTLYSALGVTYDQRDERAKAATAYQRALALQPDEPTVLNNYAVSRMLAGDLDRADQLLRKAAARGGDYPKIANNLQMIAEMRAKNGMASTGPESAINPAPATIIAKAARAAPQSRETTKAIAQAAQPRALQPSLPHGLTKKTAPRIVMQKVPYDPLAGKVYGTHGNAAPHRLAAAEQREGPKSAAQAVAQTAAKAEDKPEPREKLAKSSAPALRTAADLY